MSSNCYSSWLWKEIANQTSSVKTVLTQISFSALGTACLGILRKLKRFSNWHPNYSQLFRNDPPYILTIVKVTPSPRPLLIAVETANILATNLVACSRRINFRHFSGEMLAFSHLKNTKKWYLFYRLQIVPKFSTNFIYSQIYKISV